MKTRPSASPSRQLSADLTRLRERWQSGALSDPVYAAAWFLLWQMDRHGPRFASRTRRDLPKPVISAWRDQLLRNPSTELAGFLTDALQHYQFFRTIPSATLALLGWLRDGWPLRLMTRIPSPREVLSQQARGQRVVTLIDLPRAIHPVLTKADGFEFLVHDLEHAWKFCHDPDQHHLQRRFFGCLEQALDSGLFDACLADPVFAERFDYLISDMNTHPVHGLVYCRAVLIESLLRREGKNATEWLSPAGQQTLRECMEKLGRLWRFPAPAIQALRNLADGQFDHAEDARRIEQALRHGTPTAAPISITDLQRAHPRSQPGEHKSGHETTQQTNNATRQHDEEGLMQENRARPRTNDVIGKQHGQTQVGPS